jgi:hypothetical protein
MRFRCIVSYRSHRSKRVSTWRTDATGEDLVTVVADTLVALKRRLRRPLTVVGIYVQLQEPRASR